jgi:hypothetical protein
VLKPPRRVRYNRPAGEHFHRNTFATLPAESEPVPAAEVVMALPVPVRSDPYHGWLLRALLALIAVLVFAFALSKA